MHCDRQLGAFRDGMPVLLTTCTLPGTDRVSCELQHLCWAQVAIPRKGWPDALSKSLSLSLYFPAWP